MSILNIARKSLYNIQASIRSICLGKYLLNSQSSDENDENYEIDDNDENDGNDENRDRVSLEFVPGYDRGDRSEVVDYLTSIKYLNSRAYWLSYGDHLVWQLYRRRATHSRFHLVRTRRTCISHGKLLYSSPCPICRDMYLVFDYRHVKLLKQFISPYYDGVLPTSITGICQRQHRKLLVEVLKAKNYGTISFDIPARYVVVGGGIAGVSCTESLKFWSEDGKILLITPSPIVKIAKSAVHLTRNLVDLDVTEENAENVFGGSPRIKVISDFVTGLNHELRMITTRNNLSIKFEKLCICAGGQPNLISESNPHVLGIRDTESVNEFQKRISKARKIIVVGNGGIASEIIHEVKGLEKVWVVKDEHISKTFLDPGASEFLKSSLEKKDGEGEPRRMVKRLKYEIFKGVTGSEKDVSSPALGPDWHSDLELKGVGAVEGITLEYGTSVESITVNEDGEWPVTARLSNGKSYGADFIVSATGVLPNSSVFRRGNPGLRIADDGGILVDEKMETSLEDVFAAGDVCTAGWEEGRHWHQMRLWGQARQMGMYAGRCMAASVADEPVTQDFCFEIFTHVTKLFGFKVILLGLFNGQKLGGDYEILLRVTKGAEYVKLVIKDGRMQGAILIGETDLEEMCENLILNQLDLTPFGDDLLNPDVDIEDYFD